MRTNLSSFYTSPIALWVEDSCTRDYLSELWHDADIRFYIAGGNDGIKGAVKCARAEGIRYVFGVVDRDFQTSNQDRWRSGHIDVYVLPRHEIENYMLDADALAGCGLNTGKRSQSDINQRLYNAARDQVSWMACRKVISDLRLVLTDDFLQHPPCSTTMTIQEAENYILGSQWYSTKLKSLSSDLTIAEVQRRLHQADQEYRTALQNNSWDQLFSGKELLRHVRDWVYRPMPGQTGSDRDSDLGKAVAAWQVQNNVVPPDLKDLHNCIRDAVGLPPM